MGGKMNDKKNKAFCEKVFRLIESYIYYIEITLVNL